MSTEVIIALLGIASTIISGWTSWFFARKKYDTEVEHSTVENMQESLNFYKQLSDDNRSRLDEMQKENQELRKQVDDLRDQVFTLMTQICLNYTCEHRVLTKPKKTKDGTKAEKNSKEG